MIENAGGAPLEGVGVRPRLMVFTGYRHHQSVDEAVIAFDDLLHSEEIGVDTDIDRAQTLGTRWPRSMRLDPCREVRR